MVFLSVHQTIVVNKTFFEKGNDIRCRGWTHRVSRFFRAQLLRACKCGELFADDPRVMVAWNNGWDPVHYIRFLRWRDEGFRPQTVYDIGAHEGLWAEMCQAVFSPKASVLFEPQTEFRKKIEARQSELGVHWTLLPFALGAEEQETVIYLTRNRAASSLLEPTGEGGVLGDETKFVSAEKVNVRPLDWVIKANGVPPPDLVKIDVQGFEGAVLAGGKDTIAMAKRVIIEVSLNIIYQNQPLLPEILSMLTGMGFFLEDISETLRAWPGGGLWQVDLWLRRAH